MIQLSKVWNMKAISRFIYLALALGPVLLATAQWSNVGLAGFSAGYAEAISLAIQPGTGNTYVAYVDYANSNKATVM